MTVVALSLGWLWALPALVLLLAIALFVTAVGGWIIRADQ